MSGYAFELLGILIALGLLIFLAFRGFTLLLAAPAAAIVAAAFSGEPVLAKWTLTFMQGTGRFSRMGTPRNVALMQPLANTGTYRAGSCSIRGMDGLTFSGSSIRAANLAP
jgi:hypothetical protein